MKVLITGGAGFIGSNFLRYMLDRYPNYEYIVIDCLTYAGHRSTLAGLEEKITLFTNDICFEAVVNKAMVGVDTVVHFAAESHVDRSISNPTTFLHTNIIGTEVLLRAARDNGVSKFHHISTDEVFGSLPLDGGTFNEQSPYAPRSPYAASKAASDHLVRAYGETFDLPYTITNCSNNYGPYQTPEKAIPLFITNALAGDMIPLYGDGLCVRDYLYVEDHCKAIDRVLHYGNNKETFCIGGGAEKNGIEIANAILSILNLPEDYIEFVGDRPGHDRRYAIDSTQALLKLGWKPSVSFEEGLYKTISWYIENRNWWQPIKRNMEILKW